MKYILSILLVFVIYRLLSFARYNWKNSNKFAATGAILLSIALHRLIKVASGKTALSAKRTSLKDASKKLMGAIPQLYLACDTRYTFFEILHNSAE